jgi:hypothetical protein
MRWNVQETPPVSREKGVGRVELVESLRPAVIVSHKRGVERTWVKEIYAFVITTQFPMKRVLKAASTTTIPVP